MHGNQAAAEDVVQETYLQGWKSFYSFEPGTNIRAWLHKIMFHVINHYWCKNNRLVSVAIGVGVNRKCCCWH